MAFSPPGGSKMEKSPSAGSSTEKLEAQLELFIENMRQINIMVTDFQPQAQTVLNQKVQRIVTDLKEISKLKKDLQDVQIPLEVCKYVDDGQNPQLFTKHHLSAALRKNEEVKGKIEAYRKFKAHLLVESTKYFPQEIERYRAIRTEEEEEEEEEEDDEEEEEEVDVDVEVAQNGESHENKNGEHQENVNGQNHQNGEDDEVDENQE